MTASCKIEMIVRVPVIPEFNCINGELEKIKEFLKKLDIKRVEFLPYHSMGEYKWRAIGGKCVKYSVPAKELMEKIKKFN